MTTSGISTVEADRRRPDGRRDCSHRGRALSCPAADINKEAAETGKADRRSLERGPAGKITQEHFDATLERLVPVRSAPRTPTSWWKRPARMCRSRRDFAELDAICRDDDSCDEHLIHLNHSSGLPKRPEQVIALHEPGACGRRGHQGTPHCPRRSRRLPWLKTGEGLC